MQLMMIEVVEGKKKYIKKGAGHLTFCSIFSSSLIYNKSLNANPCQTILASSRCQIDLNCPSYSQLSLMIIIGPHLSQNCLTRQIECFYFMPLPKHTPRSSLNQKKYWQKNISKGQTKILKFFKVDQKAQHYQG